MSLREHWNDFLPSRRCDWIDQLRGWAVIVMIEVHCVNVWLPTAMRPEWLNFLNGLVAPSFLMAAGFSLVLSTFKTDGTLRPFWPETAKRLGFILLCAYALHCPGFTLAEWTVLAAPQRLRELFKIDVLQCIVFSLLVLQALARIIRRPRIFAFAALFVALGIPLISTTLWIEGTADGLWLPLRGLFNSYPDRGVAALFPLFPWLAFPAFGAFLGGMYRWMRVEDTGAQRSRMSELGWLLALLVLGLGLWTWGVHTRKAWLWAGTWKLSGNVWRLHGAHGAWTYHELLSMQNVTLPSVAHRLGWICMGGAALGLVERFRPRLPGPNPVEAASRESLLLYMLHLNLIFGLILTPPVLSRTGWDWYSQGWTGTLLLTAGVIGFNLVVGILWQRVRKAPDLMRGIQRSAVAALALWFLVGGWTGYRFLSESPELATEPYAFLNKARVRKGLQPTPDGLTRDPEEYFRAAEYWKMPLSPSDRERIRKEILARNTEVTSR